jgi:hypothetical protein
VSTAAETWIAAAEALALVQQHVGDEDDAKDALTDWLEAGLLRCHVRKVLLHGPQGRHEKDGGEVATTFWAGMYASSDLEDWRWGTGDFTVAKGPIPQRPDRAYSLYGARFLKEELLARLPSTVSHSSRKGIGGAKRKAEGWDALTMALVELALDGRLKGFKSQVELRAELLHLINLGLSEDAIKPLVSQIWNKFVEPSR